MDIQELIERYQDCGLLRFTTAGSVDDGKSTLIGQLLLETHSVYLDQLTSVRQASVKLNREETDLAMFTDGLKAEREQGITIDVAYRQFFTPRRRFIIADTPGHEQYTRNMATGASTAVLAVVLIDARLGLLAQSRRHLFISSLLGIPRIVVAVNKMDLVEYREDVYREIVRACEDFSARLDLQDLSYIPVSALRGDNVFSKSIRMPWYEGLPLLAHLEQSYTGGDHNLIDFRFPVQLVLRPHQKFRGYAGKISSGVVRSGDRVQVLPSGESCQVTRILRGDEELSYAFAPMSITLCLDREIDLSRGDMVVHPANLPKTGRNLEAMLVWMNQEPMETGKTYLFKHTTQTVRGMIAGLHYRVEPEDLRRRPAANLALNEIGRVDIHLQKALYYDEYSRNRVTGAFVVIDPVNHATLGAGMIIDRSSRLGTADRKQDRSPKSENIVEQSSQAGADARQRVLGHRSVVMWFSGLSGAGKSTIAYGVEKKLIESGHAAFVLDGDNIRFGLNRDLGFTAADRSENIRRVAEVAKLMADAGLLVLTSFISPFRDDRNLAREIIGPGRFVEVFVDAPLAVCEARDVKGLYQKARNGRIPEFTGVSSPYEPPLEPELHIRTAGCTVEQAMDDVLAYLRESGFLPA